MKSQFGTTDSPIPWNKGQANRAESAAEAEGNLAIRLRVPLVERTRDLTLFKLAIDSKLCGCDLVSLEVYDIAQGKSVLSRAIVIQHKTKRPVQFEITEQTRQSVALWIEQARLTGDQYLFPSKVADSPHLSTRQLRAW